MKAMTFGGPRFNDQPIGSKAEVVGVRDLQAIASHPVPCRTAEARACTAFLDPWCCGACYVIQKLCRLHEAMEMDGYRPRPYDLRGGILSRGYSSGSDW
jgi:hypothetical protein